jgi:hypothetical protein
LAEPGVYVSNGSVNEKMKWFIADVLAMAKIT